MCDHGEALTKHKQLVVLLRVESDHCLSLADYCLLTTAYLLLPYIVKHSDMQYKGSHGRTASFPLLTLHQGSMAVTDTALSRTTCEMQLHQIIIEKEERKQKKIMIQHGQGIMPECAVYVLCATDLYSIVIAPLLGFRVQAAEPVVRKGPSPEQITAIKAAIANAQTLEEVQRLENALTSGHLPSELQKDVTADNAQNGHKTDGSNPPSAMEEG